MALTLIHHRACRYGRERWQRSVLSREISDRISSALPIIVRAHENTDRRGTTEHHPREKTLSEEFRGVFESRARDRSGAARWGVLVEQRCIQRRRRRAFRRSGDDGWLERRQSRQRGCERRWHRQQRRWERRRERHREWRGQRRCSTGRERRQCGRRAAAATAETHRRRSARRVQHE